MKNNLQFNFHFIFIVSVILLLVIYWQGISGPFIHDDLIVISPLFERSEVELYSSGIMSSSGMFGRPISMLSFLININFSGNSTEAFKITNICIHLINYGLLFLLFIQILGIKHLDIKLNNKPVYAFLAASIWAFHPLHVSTVLYTVQRMTELSALFSLSGMLLYIYGRRSNEKSAGASGLYAILVVFMVCLPSSILCKENGVLLPAYCLLIELILFKGRGLQQRNIQVIYLLFLFIPAILGAYYYASNFDSKIIEGSLRYGFTYSERLLTEARVLILHIKMFLTSDISSMGFHYDDIELSKNLFTPVTTLFSIFIIFLSIIFSVINHKKWPILCFGIMFFYLGHLLESSFIPLKLAYEHRNYLPSIGLIFIVLSLMQYIQVHASRIRFLVLIPLVTIPLLLLLRVSAWSEPLSLALNNYQARPNSDHAMAEYVEQLSQNGRVDMAMKILSQSDSAGAKIQKLYLDCITQGKIDKEQLLAVSHKDKMTDPVYPVTGLMEISTLGLNDKCIYPSEVIIEKLSQFSELPMSVPSWKEGLLIHRAYQEHKLGLLEEALDSLDAAREIAPASVRPDFLAARWLLQAGSVTDAIESYQQGLSKAEQSREDLSAIVAEIQNDFHNKGVQLPVQ